MLKSKSIFDEIKFKGSKEIINMSEQYKYNGIAEVSYIWDRKM